MDVKPFRIERYYARYEFSTRYMLSSSDCESRTIASLLELEPDAHARLLGTWCGYTESPGAPELRAAIAGLYEHIDPDEVIVTSCAEEAIFLLHHALLAPGDHAIVETPCYESALELARAAGAEVSPWRRHYDEGWAHDLDALERSVRATTRVLYVNQPHNPTGTLMDRAMFERVAELARAHRIVLFSDEVYRELEHASERRLPAACDLDEKAVSLGSISKSYGLPGLRLGWLVTRNPAMREAILRLSSAGSGRCPARSDFRTSAASRTSKLSASDWPDRASCSCRAPCTTSRPTCGSGSGAPTWPRRSPSSSQRWRRRRRLDRWSWLTFLGRTTRTVTVLVAI